MSAPTLSRDALFKKLRSKPENKVCSPVCLQCRVWVRGASGASYSRHTGNCSHVFDNSRCHRLWCGATASSYPCRTLVLEVVQLRCVDYQFDHDLCTARRSCVGHEQEPGALCRYALIALTRILLGLQCPMVCTSAWPARACTDRLGYTSPSSALPI